MTKHATLDQHREFGSELSRIRAELTGLLGAVDAVAPRSSGITRALVGALDRIDKCRSELDAQCCREHPAEFEPSIYYGGHPAKVAS